MALVCLCGGVAFVSAFLFNKYAVPEYAIGATILIQSDEFAKKSTSDDILAGNNIFRQMKSFKNELAVVGSTPLVKKAVERLSLHIKYYKEKGFFTHDIYNAAPFYVIMDETVVQPVKVMFKVKIIDETKYSITAEKESVTFYDYVAGKKKHWLPTFKIDSVYRFGQVVQSDLYKFSLMVRQPSTLKYLIGLRVFV
ncbi:MAG: hypothetical protein HC896_04255, partial [Bacteroidales bacterium]|nr:hypothetical protein [Bacteroidales bacterium]